MQPGSGERDDENLPDATCPLCSAEAVTPFARDKRRSYLQCLQCELVHVPARHLISPEEEKKRYDLHCNSPHHRGYRAFLGRMVHCLHDCLPPAAGGLDFGSGPEPLLAALFRDSGRNMDVFDPFYAPDPAVFQKRYDFITATEVIEHLREPGRELDRLWNCLKPGGRLGIMTKPLVDRQAFQNWHYKNDLTHIRFYSRATFLWLAGKWDAAAAFAEDDIVLFSKNREKGRGGEDP